MTLSGIGLGLALGSNYSEKKKTIKDLRNLKKKLRNEKKNGII